MDVQVNYWAVLAAAVSSMVVGMIWYTPGVFGAKWAKLARVDLKKMSTPQPMPLIVTFILSLITAYVLAHVSFLSNNFFHHSFVQDAVTTAGWLWLGLTATRLWVHDLFESRPWQLTMLNATHELVTLLVMGLVIGWMGV